MISLKDYQSLLSDCCEIDALAIATLDEALQAQLREILPTANSVLVYAHKIAHSLEWTWFDFPADGGKTSLPANMHANAELGKLAYRLEKNGFASMIIPYPKDSGLQYKAIASLSDLGKIGDSFLFLHREWGPWVFLRLLLTEAIFTDTLEATGEVCIHCTLCIKACPSKSIRVDGFNGKSCEAYCKKIVPTVTAYKYQCEICARCCPIGTIPAAIRITEA